LGRKRFPALELGPDEGIIAITTGVKADDLGDQKRRRSCTIESSTNRRCEYAWNWWDLSTSHRSITTKRWSRPPRRLASNSRSKVTNRCGLRTEGRVRRQRSQDVGNTLRAGCSRVSMRRVRTAHRALATRCYLSADRRERLLRRQPLDPPRFALARIAKAIMQAVGTALPEFDSLRFHPITAPVGWTGNFLAGKSLF